MKEFLLKNKMIILIVGVVALFVVLSVIIKDNNNEGKTMNKNMETWLTDTQEEDYVVTVIGQTTCGHCINYKPVMQKVYNENDINVYWIEANNLTSDQYNTLTSTYELENYNGTPYTFITYNGEFIADMSGARDEETLLDFLKANNVIE